MFAVFDLLSDANLVLDHNLAFGMRMNAFVFRTRSMATRTVRFFKHSILAGPKTLILKIVWKIQN